MFVGFPDFNISEGVFPNINLQDKLNWAEEFIQNVLIPRLPEAVAAHFPVELGTVLVMFAVAGIFVAVVPLLPLVLVLAERKVAARFQNRTGPMRVGPWGTLQTLADGIKLIFKEDFIPPQGDKLLFLLAPYIIFACSFAVFAAIPFGDGIPIPGDFNIGIFYIMAISSVIVMGVIMAGWSSNSKWSLLGSLRSAAQIVSYEIPLGLSILTVVMLVQSLSMTDIVSSQSNGIFSWLIFRTPFTFIAFFIFFISAIAEVNRTPFDLPEAESEIVAGFHTEYSGMRFALFFIAEYANMFAVSAIAVTLFLGGWEGVLPGYDILGGFPGFVIKTLALVFLMMWLRWTLPRLRVDQLMNLCWKYFIPIAFFNILGTGIWGLIFPEDTLVSIIISCAIIYIGLIVAYTIAGRTLAQKPEPQPS
ncbi:NADH-quinone oxidoreductase subunit NuoH [Candidatus Poribacteria bacterium]|nr:NADH-quinone oxidoreductase subunit NuoH [Candidatus Poribacteria bacterium]MYG08824.1 NADH-quinone oxidoreductase subunit NuoH [Candidatus Poribacteria bacterium]MYK24662.1 NADH-quinone oxidoreductase subunit NuoH [Candidatus Poribacteria bacterium]